MFVVPFAGTVPEDDETEIQSAFVVTVYAFPSLSSFVRVTVADPASPPSRTVCEIEVGDTRSTGSAGGGGGGSGGGDVPPPPPPPPHPAVPLIRTNSNMIGILSLSTTFPYKIRGFRRSEIPRACWVSI